MKAAFKENLGMFRSWLRKTLQRFSDLKSKMTGKNAFASSSFL